MGLAPNHHLPLAAVHARTIARHNPGSDADLALAAYCQPGGVGFGRRLFMSIPSEQACLPATDANQGKARICSLFCESGRIPFAVLSRTRPAIPAASSPLSLPTNDLFQSGRPRRWSASLRSAFHAKIAASTSAATPAIAIASLRISTPFLFGGTD